MSWPARALVTVATAVLLVVSVAPDARGQGLATRVRLPMVARDAAPRLAGAWEWLNARPSALAIRAVAAPSESVAWVVGDEGTIARTSDGGGTWSVQRSGVTSILYGVGAASPEVAWAVGVGGVIVRTIDGGATWTRQSPNTTTDLAAIAVVSPSVAWVAAGKGLVLRTEDAGETWVAHQTVALGRSEAWTHFGIAATSALDAWAVGSEGRIAITHDGGRTWSVSKQPDVSPLYAVTVRGQNLVWAVGDGGVLVSRDGGATWQRPSVGRGPYRAVAIASETKGWVVGAAGAFLETTDAGATFTGPRRFDSYLTGVVAPTASTAWIVGEGRDENHGPGLVYKTTDGGVTWVDQRRRPFADLPLVAAAGALSPAEAWFVGRVGTVLHTTDGGASFRREVSGTTQDLVDVAAVTPSVAWAISSGDTIIRTDDGGASWRVQRAGEPTFGAHSPRRLSAVSPSAAWGISYANRFFRTVDEGRTWSAGSISPDPNFIPTDIAALSADTAWVSGFVSGAIPGEVFSTTDGGATWTRHYSRIYHPLQTIAALSATTVLAGGGSELVASTDGGATWATRCCGAGELAAAAPALWVSAAGGTFVSTSAGSSWTRTGPSVHRLAAVSEGSAWAVRYGEIGRFHDPSRS